MGVSVRPMPGGPRPFLIYDWACGQVVLAEELSDAEAYVATESAHEDDDSIEVAVVYAESLDGALVSSRRERSS